MKPSCVVEYNHQMGGVDLVDQQLHNFHTLRKSYKWYRKLALRLLMQCTMNAHKAYQLHTGDRKKDFLSFTHDVINVTNIKPQTKPRSVSSGLCPQTLRKAFSC